MSEGSAITAVNVTETIGQVSEKIHGVIQNAKQKLFGTMSETFDNNRVLLNDSQETAKCLQQEISEDLNAAHAHQSCETVEDESDSDTFAVLNSPHTLSEVLSRPHEVECGPQLLTNASSDDSTQSDHSECRGSEISSEASSQQLNMWEWSDEDEGDFGDSLNSADSAEEVESEDYDDDSADSETNSRSDLLSTASSSIQNSSHQGPPEDGDDDLEMEVEEKEEDDKAFVSTPPTPPPTEDEISHDTQLTICIPPTTLSPPLSPTPPDPFLMFYNAMQDQIRNHFPTATNEEIDTLFMRLFNVISPPFSPDQPVDLTALAVQMTEELEEDDV